MNAAPFHYVYKITDPNTGFFYIGKRSCWCQPEEDKKYMGSGVWTRAIWRFNKFLVKEILSVFDCPKECSAFEMQQIKSYQDDDKIRNKCGLKGKEYFPHTAIASEVTGTTSVSVTPTTLAALQRLSDTSNVPIVRILESLVMPEYDAVMQGKVAVYPRPTTNGGG